MLRKYEGAFLSCASSCKGTTEGVFSDVINRLVGALVFTKSRVLVPKNEQAGYTSQGPFGSNWAGM